MDKCRFYSSIDQSKCHTCVEGFTGKGDSLLFDSCECDGERILAQDENFNSVCVILIVDCLYYYSLNT